MSNDVVHIDFETRSVVDLKKAGTHVYACHSTTDALCLAYARGNEKVGIWKLGEPLPEILQEYARHPEIIFAAHNAAFEFLIWNDLCARKYGWPQIPLNRFDCTMIRGYNMGLPGTLDGMSKAVGMSHEKDLKGHRIMMQLCKPRNIDEKTGEITWWNVEDSTKQLDIYAKYEALYRYCIQDIIVERELDQRLLQLTPTERKIWHLDQKINYRGVYLDEVACEKAITLVTEEKKKFNKTVKRITDGAVNTCNSHVALREWINKQGIECESVRKADVLDMIADDGLPDKVRKVLLLRQEASKSSTSKLKAMITGKSVDGRVRGCFQYYGAASTGRWAGRRIQLQNMKRPNISQKEIEDIMKRLNKAPVEESHEYLDMFYGSVINPIANCLRAKHCS